MRLLCLSPPRSRVAHPRVIALWGLGLIGRAIHEQLRSLGPSLDQELAFPWQGEKAQIEAAEIILPSLLQQVAASRQWGIPSVALIWSAGKIGFAASETETSQEMLSFKVVLHLAQALRDRLPDTRVEFHLMSSAGGLCEASRYVEPGTSLSPCRPYGNYKLDQERALLDADGLLPCIYRPSSVYGPIQGEARRGLIPILIRQGLLRQVVQVFGTLTTLRDYVYVGDVAGYVAEKVADAGQGETTGGVTWLVAGRPFSILEVKHLVERVLRHPLYLALHYDPVNSRDITFSPRLRPATFQPTALDIGIARVYHRWLSHKG